MNKQNLLTLTLIISGLALNPVMADAVANTIASTQTIKQLSYLVKVNKQLFV